MDDFGLLIDNIKEKFKTLAPDTIKSKAINYGTQVTMTKGTQKVVLSVYNGKKGRKYVWGGTDCPLREEAHQALTGCVTDTGGKETGVKDSGGKVTVGREIGVAQTLTLLSNQPGFDYLWAGSDESGKGDFFGPLVVAAVLVNKDIAQKLAELGVRDSKELIDKKIRDLAEQIMACAPHHAVLALKPAVYNQRYAQLKATGKNLNNLLSNGHVNALSKVLRENPACRFALVDRFTLHNNIGEKLQEEFPYLTVVQQPRAEADMAVAAASILARAKFVEIMKELSMLAERELPKGGGAAATSCAKELAEAKGVAVLDQFVKKHFANYKVIIGK